MENKKIIMVSVLVVVAMFGAIFSPIGFIGNVRAIQDMPHNIWGIAYSGDDPASPSKVYDGHEITAWIDGVFYPFCNATTNSSSMFDLYILSDHWGAPIDEYNKSGAYNQLDEVMFFLDYDPMDYYFIISDTVVTYVNGTIEYMDLFFDTNTTFEDPGPVDHNLRGLKINEIVLDPVGDYIYIYDPWGEIDEAELESSYYLQKDDPTGHTPNGPIFDFSANPNQVENYPLGSNSYYINLTGFTLNTEDELKLVWDNPGTAHNVAGGNDVIVDRVEWGNYQNFYDPDPPYIQTRDYDNTSMLDCPGSLGAGQSWIRTPLNGTDSNNCEVDFTVATANPRAPPPPYTVDFIAIVIAPNDGQTNVTDMSIDVGQSFTGFAAAFNYSAPGNGYIYDVIVTWTVTQGTTNASTNPLSGTSSVFYSGFFGGTAVWTAEYVLTGDTDTVTFTVNPPTVDYVKITDTPNGAELLGGTVLNDTIEMGWCSGYNNTIDYIGVQMGDWTADGGNSALENVTTASYNGINVGDIAGDVWLNVTFGSATPFSVYYNVTLLPPEEGLPGAPKDLMVHKGGATWGGTTNDLVLNWTSPDWNYTNLRYYIVYWDTDLSNGFQYTNYWLIPPNSTVKDSPDWCILPDFLADSEDYTFVVRATNDTVGSKENMTGTNVGYKSCLDLEPTMVRLWVSIPYLSDYDYAHDIAGAMGEAEFTNGDVVWSIRKWNYTAQKYESWTFLIMGWVGTDFDIEPGDAILVSLAPPISTYTWKIVGAHDPTFQFGLIENPGPQTDYRMLSLPYHRIYQMASDITDLDFPDGSKIETVGQYNYLTGVWDTRKWSWGDSKWHFDFTIYPAPKDAILFEITAITTYPWAPQVMSI